MAGILSGAASGAATGSALGPWGTVGGAVLGALPGVVKFFTGSAQRRKANRINPVDPGFQANTGILDNKRVLNEMYNNYTLPGKAAIQSQLGANFAGGVASAEQASGSSGDALDAITKLNYGNTQAINALGTQEAEMKAGLLPQVFDANAAAGNELVRQNQFDEDRYQAQLREKAALTQAGATNQFSAADQLATLGGSLLNYKAEPWSPNQQTSKFKQLPKLNFSGGIRTN